MTKIACPLCYTIAPHCDICYEAMEFNPLLYQSFVETTSRNCVGCDKYIALTRYESHIAKHCFGDRDLLNLEIDKFQRAKEQINMFTNMFKQRRRDDTISDYSVPIHIQIPSSTSIDLKITHSNDQNNIKRQKF